MAGVSPSSLKFKLVFAVVIATAAVALFVSFKVSQHAVDHLEDTQLATARSVEEGVDAINRDVKAMTAYIKNVAVVDPEAFGAFVTELKSQGLCAVSLVGIGVKPISNIAESRLSYGQLTPVEMKEISLTSEFTEAVDLASRSQQPTVSRGFRAVIDREWTNVVVFITPATDGFGDEHVVYSVHDSEKLALVLIPGDPSTHGVGAYSVSITDNRDDSVIGKVVFRESMGEVPLTNLGASASILNTYWSVRMSAPEDYAQLRSDRAAVPSVALGGLTIAWMLSTVVVGIRRRQDTLRERANTAEHRYSEQIGENVRLEANSQVVLEAATEAILLVDQDRKIVGINQSFRSLFDVIDGDWMGRVSSEIKLNVSGGDTVPDGYHSDIDAIYNDRSYSEQSRIIKIIKADGTVHVSRSTVPVVDANGSYLGRLWIYHDVTSAQELTDARSKLVSVVSHELRTPLTTVRGHIDLLADGLLGDMPSKQSKSINAASRALGRLGILIDDLLDLSRIDSDSMAIAFDVVPVDLLVENLVDEFSLRFEQANLTVKTEIDAPGNIWCDPYRFSQIVANLLSNSERYTPAGGSVTVNASFEGADFVLVVSDTGIGIPANKLDQIFDPFTTASAVCYNKESSTGLGLAIVRGLVDLHKGSVEVTSTVGLGSTFRVAIPIAPEGFEANPLTDGIGIQTL